MKSLAHKLILAVAASLTLILVSAITVSASQPKALLLNPNPGPSFYLPKFGFDSFNIYGVGDRVTYVRWGGLASQMGLEPGDVILSMNGFPLHYHGAWNDALLSAMQSGGLVQLTIRDVRTGWIAQRQVFVGGGYGPITPKYHVAGYGPTTSHIVIGGGYPVGPITTKKMVGPQNNPGNSVQQIVKLFKD